MYWKQVHLQETSKLIPIDKKGRNHIRIELRIKKQLGRYFNKTDIRLANLYTEKFYINVFDKWKDAYSNIQAAGAKIEQIEIPTRKTELLENLASIALSILSPIKVPNQINEAQIKGNLTAKQAYDMRSMIEDLQSRVIHTNPSELVEEINSKVERVIKFYK